MLSYLDMEHTYLKALIITFITSIFTLSYNAFGQQKVDCNLLLDSEPYFAGHKVAFADSLFQRDITIIKQCGNLDSLDRELLKVPVLGSIMLGEVRKGKPATYRTIINYISNFKKTPEYEEFATGVLLYRKLENKKADTTTWDEDKKLFVRMGFSESDLEDFKLFVVMPQHKDMTYKQLYIGYMNELEKLGPPKKK